MKILLTGATGFIGSRLLKSLSSAQDNKLYCTTRAAKKPGDGESITWIHQDFSKKLDLSLFPVRLDTIIHLAQSKNYRNFPEQAIDIFDINVSSTVQLLDYGRQAGISSFVSASTGGVYGYKDSPILETDMVADISKMKLKLGVNPKIFLKEGLSRVVTSLLEKE